MGKRAVFTTAFVSALLLLLVSGAIFVDLAKANAIPPPKMLPTRKAYIRSNGDVDPPTLPIERSGNVYVLKEDLSTYSIIIEKDGVVLDGNDFSLTLPAYGATDEYGNPWGAPVLIQIKNRTDVTIKNFNVFHCAGAISVVDSSYITIAGNRLTQCESGVFMDRCFNCTIIRNVMDNNDYGLSGYRVSQFDIKYNEIRESGEHAVVLDLISNSRFIGNVFAQTRHGNGICYLGTNNLVIGNTFYDNGDGILSYQEGNEIHHNNFINNGKHIAINAPNILDDGEEGNYWSGYQISDANHDGIGDSPIVIPSIFVTDNESNVDHYPRVSPYVLEAKPLAVEVTSPQNQTYNSGNITLAFNVSATPSRTAYCLDGSEPVTFSGDVNLTGLAEGAHNLTVHAEDVFGNEGDSKTIEFSVDMSTEASDNFLLVLIVAVSAPVAIVAVGLLFYFKKRKR